jgi:polyhydroxybutyrate depolymerase
MSNMKKAFLISLTILVCIAANAQRIGIGTNSPDTSAILDIRSTNKGVLLPKVYLQSIYDSFTIPKPALALLVYNTNRNLYDGAGYYAWNGFNWDVLLSTGNIYKKGKNHYTTLVDGDMREYFVHVPKDYDLLQPTPVVFMLHGTTGDGERMYNISGWKEVGDDENILTVYPSSWKYFIMDAGIPLHTTKWNIIPDGEFTFLPGQTGRDDIKFLRKIIAELQLRFNVDTTRMYVEGFSNGGQMAAKCAIEMSDKFAAAAENSGSFFKDTIYTPLRKIPVLFQMGNEDFGPGVTGPTINLNLFDTLLQTPGNYYYLVKKLHIRNFGLDSNFILSGNNTSTRVADFHGPNINDTLNVFKMIFVKDLGHKFPNGENHWMEAAKTHWAWMKKYRRL